MEAKEGILLDREENPVIDPTLHHTSAQGPRAQSQIFIKQFTGYGILPTMILVTLALPFIALFLILLLLFVLIGKTFVGPLLGLFGIQPKIRRFR